MKFHVNENNKNYILVKIQTIELEVKVLVSPLHISLLSKDY